MYVFFTNIKMGVIPYIKIIKTKMNIKFYNKFG